MTTYSDNPQDIIFNNRSRTPTIEELTAQVTSLARILVNQNLNISTTAQTPTRLASLQNRSLNSDFIISNIQDALVFYTIELSVSLTLSGTDSETVTLMVNNVANVSIKNLITLVLGLLSLTQTNTQQEILIGFVPAGSTVNLTTSGTGTATLLQSMEVLL